MITNSIPKCFAAEDDCRAISQDGPLWKALSEGELSALVELVKNKPDLELCFRGNSSTDSITVYYNNNQFVRYYESNNRIKATFNRDHARYFEDREKINKQIAKELKRPGDFENFYDLRKKVMRSYFDESLTKDYIKGIVLDRKKDCKYEKQEQQKLMTANTNRENGYYIYDMEYAQAFQSREVKEIYEKLTASEKHNKPDSLAIRYEEGKPVALVFVELKTTKSAMTGNSSAINHIIGMRNFVEWDKKKNKGQFIKNRLVEAHEVMEEYQILNLHGCGIRKVEDFTSLPVELLLVITGNERINLPYSETAKAYLYKDSVKERIHKVASDNECGIIVLDPGEYELKYENILN